MGSVVPDQTVELVVDTPSLAVVDGKFGYEQTVAPQAVKIGIENARLPVYPPSRCAMPVISAASATGRRWQQRKDWYRFTSSTPRARCW
jgi:hypothetical protein